MPFWLACDLIFATVEKPGDRARPSWWTSYRETFAALATIIVVPAIFVTLLIAYFTFHNQLSHESHEEALRQRVADRAQAEQVSAVPLSGRDAGFPSESPTHGEPYTRIAMYNRSATPVYNVVVTLVLVQGSGPRTANELTELRLKQMFQRYYSTLPPGEYEARVSGDWVGMMARPGIEIAFRDSGGRSWVRFANGILTETPAEPVAYYHLQEPIGWEVPRAVN